MAAMTTMLGIGAAAFILDRLIAGGLGFGQYKLGGKQVGLQAKQMESMVSMGKREEERTSEFFEKLMALRAEERGESREIEAMRMIMGGQDQQTALLMSLMQQGMQRPRPRTRPSYPPSSMVSLLR